MFLENFVAKIQTSSIVITGKKFLKVGGLLKKAVILDIFNKSGSQSMKFILFCHLADSNKM